MAQSTFDRRTLLKARRGFSGSDRIDGRSWLMPPG